MHACMHAHTHCCCVIFITALMDLRLSRDNPCRMNKHLIISSWWSKSWVEQLRGLLPSRPATNAAPNRTTVGQKMIDSPFCEKLQGRWNRIAELRDLT